MATIQALINLRLRSADGEFTELPKGGTLDVPQGKADRLLAKIPAVVRIVRSDCSSQNQAEAATQTTADGPTALEQGVLCFQMEVGPNPKPPAIRLEPHPKGSWVEVQSPVIGRFRAQVLRDDGVNVWIFHPALERESSVPNSRLVGVVDGPTEGEPLDVKREVDNDVN